ncbi:TonB-dependent receptor [Massilia sp. YMA4]|uniref:TonB-dependent receptor n=1 Tax=Massilia sp. YMA4 TaxID=1593482 RepID=UPI000DD15D75|nr:TonB-dependent receptor [Massilia sp. YMA4]AXA89778.1 TonB-dependent receptor [Massilia sp. YMA4]
MFILSAGGRHARRRKPGALARRFVAAALPAAFFTSHAAAQDAAAHVPVIKVLGHYDNGVGTSDAASQGTVTAGLIASRPALRPGELLEFVPGVIVTQHSGDGKANQYFLRGFNLDHGTDFATYVDGMPVNMRTHAHGQGYTDLNFLIPELVGRINYKKGPYYADEGDFASAGAARMELADRLDASMAALTAGAHQYRRALVAGAMPQGGGNLLYALELAHNDGPWQLPEAFHKWSGVLRYSAASGADRFSVTAMGYRAGWRATSQIPLRAVQSGQLDAFGTLDPSDAGHTSRYSLSAQWKRRGPDTAWQASAYVVRSDLTLYNNFTWFLDDPQAGDQFLQRERRTMTGFDASHTWHGRVGERASSTTVGVQGRFDRIGPLVLAATADQQLLRSYARSRVDEASAALWLQNTLQWTPWLRSIAGLRHDRYRFDVASSIAANSGVANDHVSSPKLSLVLGPWAATELFVNHGAGFHSNDARGTTAHVAPREGTPVDPVTPLVKTRGSEIGLRSEIVKGLQSSLALWRLRSGSELVFSGDAGDTSASRASRRHGIEWNNHYIAAPWLLFDLDLAYSRARYLGDDPAGAHVPGAVERVASFGATVNDVGPGGRWSGAFQLRYFGPRPLVEDNSVRSSATALAYLRAGYRIDRDWHLSVDVFNLFDRRGNDIEYYYASRLPGEAPGGVEDIHFHPGEPRTARLTLRLAF